MSAGGKTALKLFTIPKHRGHTRSWRFVAGISATALVVTSLIVGPSVPTAQATVQDSVCVTAGRGIATPLLDGPVGGPNPASFRGPSAIAVAGTASNEKIFVADIAGNADGKIRLIESGNVTTLDILPPGTASVNEYISALAVDRNPAHSTNGILYGAGYGYIWRYVIGGPNPKATVIAGTIGTDRPSTSPDPDTTGPAISALVGLYVTSLAVNSQGDLFYGEVPRQSSDPAAAQLGGRVLRLNNAWVQTADASRRQVLVAGSGAYGPPQAGPSVSSPISTNLQLAFVNNQDALVYQFESYIVAVDAAGNQTILNYVNNRSQSEGGDGGPLASANLATGSLIADPSSGTLLTYGGYISRFQTITNLESIPLVNAFAGTGAMGYVDGPGATAEFAISNSYSPNGAAFGPDGNVYVSDFSNHRIRKIVTATRVVSTVAGSGESAIKQSGSGRNLDLQALKSITRDPSNGDIYFGTDYHRIYKMNKDGIVVPFAGSGKSRYTANFSYTNKPANEIDIGFPGDIAIDPVSKDVYVEAWASGSIIRIQQVAGVATGATVLRLNSNGATAIAYGNSLAVDNANLYMTFRELGQIRKAPFPAAGSDTLNDVLVAGQPSGTRISANDSPAASTNIGEVFAIAVDAKRNVFFAADNGVGRLDVNTNTVARIAGTYVAGIDQGALPDDVTNPDVAAIKTRTIPSALAVDPSNTGTGDVYWTDNYSVMGIQVNATDANAKTYQNAIAKRLASKLTFTQASLPDFGNGGPAGNASFRALRDLVVGTDQEVSVSDSYSPNTGNYASQIRSIATNGCARLRSVQDKIDARSSGSGVPISEIPASGLPLGLPGYGNVTLGSTALNGTNISNAPLASIPLASIPLASIPLASIPLASIPLASIPLASIPLLKPAGGWEALFAGTSLQGVPPQNIKLTDVFCARTTCPYPDVTAKVQSISLRDIDVSGTPLASISLASIVLGTTPLASIKLPTPNPNAFLGWCEEIVKYGPGCAALGITAESTVFELDLKSVPLASIPLASIPLASIPLASIPLASIKIGDTPLASIPLASIPLASIDFAVSPLASIPLASIPLASIPLASIVIDCTTPACQSQTLGQAAAAGKLRPGVTLGEIFLAIKNRPASDLGPGMPSNVTFGDFMLLFINRADLPWESIGLDRLKLTTLGTPDPSQLVSYNATFEIKGDLPIAPVTLTAEMPAGFSFVDGSNSVSFAGTPIPSAVQGVSGSPTAPPSAAISFMPLSTGAPSTVEVNFQLRTGFVTGDTKLTYRLSPTNMNASEVLASYLVNVSDANEPNDSVGNQALPVLVPDTLVTGAFPIGDPIDFYRVNSKGPKGTRNTFYLSHLAKDADIVIYESTVQPPLREGALRIGQSAPLAQPVDPQLRAIGGPIDPQTAQDIGADLAGYRVVGYSAKRGVENDTVEVVSSGLSGGYIVQVRPYNGESFNAPYLLRLKQVVPPGLANCAPLAPLQAGGIDGIAPANVAGKSSVILVNRKRLGDTFGGGEVEGVGGVMARLDELAAATNGVVVSVDADTNVRSSYDVWNGSPCDVDAANGVVRSINAYVDSLFPAGPARAALKSITVVGSDQQIPMGRVADDAKEANEANYAADLISADGLSTPLSAAAGNRNILSDDPYAAFNLRTYGTRILYSPDVAIGRLVETPSEIIKSVNVFLTPASAGLGAGEIDPQTSLITGYDFLSDGATAVHDGLAPRIPTQSTLINDTWTRGELDGGVFPTVGASPAVIALNAHFSHNEALPASGNTTGDFSDLFTTADVNNPTRADRLARRILLSMGCHAGINVPDVYVGASARKLDWAQAFAQQGATFIANTGFGYGDTKFVAYSEKLQRELAKNLTNGATVADALRFAKQSYLADGLTDVYDPKVLMETTYYGVPNVRLSGTFVPPTEPVAPPLGVDPKTGIEASDFNVNTPPTLATTGSFYTVIGQDPLAADNRPIQPRTTLDITQAGRVSHGALITALASNDVPNFEVQFASPTIDLSANEPVIVSRDLAWPSFLQNITSFTGRDVSGANVDRQKLVLATGQWFSTSPTNPRIGTQRLFTAVKGRVFYRPASDTDFTAPTIVSTSTVNVGGTVNFTVKATDANGIKRALVLYLDGPTWRSLDLAASTTGTFEGATPTTSASLDYFVQVVDGSGNVGVSSNKAALFNGSGTGGGTPVVVEEPPLVPVPNVAPVVSAVTVTQVANGGSTTVTASGSFTDADSISWNGTFNWGDGSAPIAFVPAASKTFTFTKTFTATGTFTYSGSVAITDDRAAVGTAPFSYVVNVAAANVAPAVVSASSVASQSGGQVQVVVSGTFNDPDSASWTGTIEWGDGSPAAGLTISGLSFSATKSFTSAANLSAIVKITDNEGATGSTTVAVAVPPRNQAPIVTAATSSTSVSGSVVNIVLAGAFTDPDSTAWTGTVNWNDGSGNKPLTINAGAKTLSAQTTSFVAGTRTGTATVCDANNACGSKTFTYTVTVPARKKIRAYLDCFTWNKTTRVAVGKFGYDNPNPYAVSIPIGSLNFFFPSPQGRGQPTQFASGRQNRVVTITANLSSGSSSNLLSAAYWFLDGAPAQLASQSLPAC